MRLIDADELKKHLQDALNAAFEGKDEDEWTCRDHIAAEATDSFLLGIDECPTIDAEPVRHAHLIIHDDDILGMTSECSACHVEGMLYGNYCVICGAKLDEEVSDEKKDL